MPELLHTLTVQDVLWINLQVTKKVHHFNYARLEEAVFYQFAYGESNSLIPQAARFVTGFMKMRPLDAGNEATAFVSFLTFLRLNGQRVKVSDAEAAGWFDGLRNNRAGAKDVLAGVVEADPHYHHTLHPDVKTAVRLVMDEYAKAVATLADRESPVAA